MSPTTKLDTLDQLKAGVQQLTQSSAWLQFLDVQRRFYHYSWGNCVLIAIQRPDATRVAGYRRWQDLGRQVRKGEKAIVILAPVVKRTTVEVDPDESAASSTVTAFRAASVFDVSQTDGEPLPQVCHRLTGDDPSNAFADLRTVASAHGFSVEVTPLAYFTVFGPPVSRQMGHRFHG
ncbi:MAG TPA: ArdC family protein [Chloroflexota bacterium]|nr:ArdC family protein [Chloroflexota bacterium]